MIANLNLALRTADRAHAVASQPASQHRIIIALAAALMPWLCTVGCTGAGGDNGIVHDKK
jgi:hypothetical protein